MPHATATRFGNNETENRRCGLGDFSSLCLSCFSRFRYQSKCPSASNVSRQFQTAIRDSRREAALVNAPQGLEIFAAKIAQCKQHPAIVAAPELFGFDD